MERVGVEIEKKYIIEKPDLECISGEEAFSASEIVQIYVESQRGVTHRVRFRKRDGVTEYTETKKIRIDAMSSTEIERDISEDEFAELSKNIRAGSKPIRKTRYTFLYEGQLFEIDVYPEWKRCAIMETELESRESQVKFPSFIRIIRDVTGIKEYSN
ncbi:MAG: hypothetical protein IJW03_03055, partial [Clostridia bacterium]|nr:hypothetical protein [Clostridia bacterium]